MKTNLEYHDEEYLSNPGPINWTNKISSLIFFTLIHPIKLHCTSEGTSFPVPSPSNPEDRVAETPLLKVFNVDKLNYNNDPQAGGWFLILYKD